MTDTPTTTVPHPWRAQLAGQPCSTDHSGVEPPRTTTSRDSQPRIQEPTKRDVKLYTRTFSGKSGWLSSDSPRGLQTPHPTQEFPATCLCLLSQAMSCLVFTVCVHKVLWGWHHLPRERRTGPWLTMTPGGGPPPSTPLQIRGPTFRQMVLSPLHLCDKHQLTADGLWPPWTSNGFPSCGHSLRAGPCPWASAGSILPPHSGPLLQAAAATSRSFWPWSGRSCLYCVVAASLLPGSRRHQTGQAFYLRCSLWASSSGLSPAWRLGRQGILLLPTAPRAEPGTSSLPLSTARTDAAPSPLLREGTEAATQHLSCPDCCSGAEDGGGWSLADLVG